MICFAWHGFPQYAARCVGAFVKTTTENVIVVATRPTVPIRGMEELCSCPVVWVDKWKEEDEERLATEITTLFVSGWYVPAFNRLRDKVRANGGRVICFVDNNFIFSLREIVKAIRFRLFFRRHYDGFIVPGRSGRRLLRFYGVPDDKIREGLYAADETLFTPGLPLEERPRKIIYVGQFCERKNVKRMVKAFLNAGVGGWELELYGSGPLKDELVQTLQNSKVQTIHIHEFLQPEELAAKYREARIFCLPSVEEHWGLVVHEAALSGCALLLSDRVGAVDDFLEEGVNGLAFDSHDLGDMTAKFVEAMTRSFETGNATERARKMGRPRFVSAVAEMSGGRHDFD